MRACTPEGRSMWERFVKVHEPDKHAGYYEVARIANRELWQSSWDFFHLQGRAATLLQRAAQ